MAPSSAAAVHRVEASASASAPELEPATLSLDALLHPMSKEEFLRNHFRQRAVVVRGGGAERAAALFPEAAAGDVACVAENSASERLMLWVRAGGSGAGGGGREAAKWGLPAPRGSKLTSVFAEDARSAAALHGAGHALYCRAPEGLEKALVNALLRDTALGLPPVRGAGQLSGHGEVEMFCARAGHVTGWHYDFQENFTVQLRGSKRWRVKRSNEAHPIRAHSLHFADASVAEDQRKAAALARDGEKKHAKKRKRGAEDGFEEVTLDAGDVLYFPAGLYHEVESLDDDNVSLNVSLVAPSWAEVITSSLRHALLGRDDFRARATSGPAALGELDGLLATLRRVAGQLTPEAILPPACTAAVVAAGAQSDGESDADGESETPDSDDDDDGEGELVIDVFNDALPDVAVPNTLWRVNPIYTATFQKEIEDQEEDSWVIINGNYGGSELLEPVVRARVLIPACMCDDFAAELKKPLAKQSWHLNSFLIAHLYHLGFLIPRCDTEDP